jgi:hypothetical protein
VVTVAAVVGIAVTIPIVVIAVGETNVAINIHKVDIVEVPDEAVVEVADQEIVRDYIVGKEVACEDTARYKEVVRCTRVAEVVGQSLVGDGDGAEANVTYQDFIKVKAIVEAIEPIIDTIVYTVDLIIDTVVYTVAPVVAVVVLAIVVAVTVVAVVVLAIVVAVTVVVFGHRGGGQSHQHSHHHGDYPKN